MRRNYKRMTREQIQLAKMDMRVLMQRNEWRPNRFGQRPAASIAPSHRIINAIPMRQYPGGKQIVCDRWLAEQSQNLTDGFRKYFGRLPSRERTAVFQAIHAKMARNGSAGFGVY